MKLETKRLGRSWWIVGDADWLPCGPYAAKAEADEDRRGLQRTLQHLDDREYWTSEKADR